MGGTRIYAIRNDARTLGGTLCNLLTRPAGQIAHFWGPKRSKKGPESDRQLAKFAMGSHNDLIQRSHSAS